jgi:hypothetical protein
MRTSNIEETAMTQWSSREEWLQKYATQFDRVAISELLSDYASATEIATAIAALKQMWSAHRKGVMEADKCGDFGTRDILRSRPACGRG